MKVPYAFRSASACALLAFSAIACAQRHDDPQQMAEKITRAVYANDLDTMTATFDDATKKTVSREALGAMSDTMHALGDFGSLAPKSADPDSGRYEYDAHFTRGAMLVRMRIDPSGKVGAYRVEPESSPTAAAKA